MESENPYGHLMKMLIGIDEVSFPRCKESKRYQETERDYKKIDEELQKTLSKEQIAMLGKRDGVRDRLEVIMRDYGYEDIFFFGMKMGVKFAKYEKEDVKE